MSDTNLVDVITRDHRNVEKIFVELESRKGTAEHRRGLADRVIAELVRHSVAEEMYMYPAVKRNVSGGDELAEHEIEEHAEAEEIMKRLEDIPGDDPAFDRTVSDLIASVRHHVEEEENKLLPKLAEACSKNELDKLGEKVQKAKKIAPTRPHPGAPDRPPGNFVVGAGIGFIDRLRDRFAEKD